MAPPRLFADLLHGAASRPLLPAAAGLVGGLLAGGWLPGPSGAWTVLGLLALGAGLLVLRRQVPGLWMVPVVLWGAALGVADRPGPLPEAFEGRAAAVVERWRPTDDGAVLHLRITAPFRAPARVRAPPGSPALAPGDRVLVTGRLEAPRGLANPGAARSGPPWLVGTVTGLVRLSSGASGPWRGAPVAAEAVRTAIRRAVGDPATAGVLQALALGTASAVPQATRDRFAEAGLAHLLAVSGLHLGFAAVLLFGGTRRLALWIPGLRLRADRVAAGVSLGAVAALVAWVGHPASAVRAGLMTWVVLGGVWLGRRPDPWTALAFACLASLAVDPGLLHSPGFQLSVTAVAGLLGFRWPPRPRRSGVLARGGAAVVGLGRATLAASLSTAPLVAHHFGRLPLTATLSNLLAVPLAGLTVPAVAGAALGSVWLGRGGDLLWGPAATLARLLIRLAEAAADLPLASRPVTSPGWLLGTAAALAVVGAARARTPGRRGAWASLVLGLLLWPAPGRPPPAPLAVTFLSVGHGDAVLVRTAAGDVLVDAGGDPQGRHDVGARVVVPALRALGVRRLSAVVATHPHPDHVGGLPAVLEAFPTGALYLTGEGADGLLAPALAAAARQGVPVRSACRDPLPPLGPVALACLHPAGTGPDGTHDPLADPNDNSVVLGVRLGEVGFLLPGDIQRDTEARLARRPAELAATVVKAPHHGSRTSSTLPWAAATGARHVVFSVGRPRRFGHPHPEVSSRWNALGAQAWNTHTHGAVTFLTDGRRLTVGSMLPRTTGGRTAGGGGSRAPAAARTRSPPPPTGPGAPGGRG